VIDAIIRRWKFSSADVQSTAQLLSQRPILLRETCRQLRVYCNKQYNLCVPILDKHTFEFFSRSAEQTRRIGMRLGGLLHPSDLICLQGNLGAGKTTLTQGLAQGLGIAGCGFESDVRLGQRISPSRRETAFSHGRLSPRIRAGSG